MGIGRPLFWGWGEDFGGQGGRGFGFIGGRGNQVDSFAVGLGFRCRRGGGNGQGAGLAGGFRVGGGAADGGMVVGEGELQVADAAGGQDGLDGFEGVEVFIKVDSFGSLEDAGQGLGLPGFGGACPGLGFGHFLILQRGFFEVVAGFVGARDAEGGDAGLGRVDGGFGRDLLEEFEGLFEAWECGVAVGGEVVEALVVVFGGGLQEGPALGGGLGEFLGDFDALAGGLGQLELRPGLVRGGGAECEAVAEEAQGDDDADQKGDHAPKAGLILHCVVDPAGEEREVFLGVMDHRGNAMFMLVFEREGNARVVRYHPIASIGSPMRGECLSCR